MSKYVIAKYIRLSMEDEKSESLSISNQRLILDKKIADMDIASAEILEFVDNGYSATNMERPAVQELLELVRSGKINCLLIKDFSRFSRNALDSGYFIEQVFPLYGVRLISVGDNFDSTGYGETGGLDVAFKFIMHEYYSADLSKKVKSAKRLQMKRGENITAKAIYGYQKIDGKWKPDMREVLGFVSSEIVKQIYKLALDGLTPSQIRDKLFAEKVPTPQEHFDLVHNKDITPEFLWQARAVTHILTNEQYKGTYISGKQESKAIGSSSKNWNPKSEWIVIPNKHTPIVSEDDFNQVQELMKRFLTSEKSPKKQVKAVAHQKNEWITNLPYGYGKDENGEWCIDEISGVVVRKIFDLALQGVHESEIAEILTAEKFPVPREHKQITLRQNIVPLCEWNVKAVRYILRDEQYTGALITGKFYFGEDGKQHRTHESDWVVVPDKIPAIISKDEYDKVAEIMANRGKRVFKQRDYLLRGNLVKCGCCGYAMSFDRTLFRCYHTAADPNTKCHKFKVDVKEIDKIVLTLIRQKSESVLVSADLSGFRGKSDIEQKICDVEKLLTEHTAQRQLDYERFVIGEISRDEHAKLKADSILKLDRLNFQLSAMKSELEASNANSKSVATAKNVLGGTLGERELVETLIEQVRVYPDKQVDIIWKISM